MPEKIIPERINKTRIKKIKINTWLEDKRYKQLKREVCRAKPFESCLYDKRGNPLGQFGTMHSTSLFTHTALMRFIFEQKQLFPEKYKTEGRLHRILNKFTMNKEKKKLILRQDNNCTNYTTDDIISASHHI